MKKRLFKKLESAVTRILFGPPLDPKKRLLLRDKETSEWVFSVGDSLTTILITGSTESGKTTKMKVLLLAMMLARYGGLVLVVKKGLPEDIMEVAKLAGREDDIVFLREDNGVRYNPFELVASATEAAALLTEIAKTLHTKTPNGVSEDKFWSELRDVQIRKLCRLCLFSHGCLSIPLLAELYRGLPDSPSHAKDPEWQKQSRAWPHLKAALERGGDEVKKAAHALLNRPSAAHSKLQDSVNALISVMLDRMDSEPLNRIFVSEGTIDMNEVLNRKKILVVDMPLLDSDSGRIANLLIQHCFMKAASRLERHGECFMLCDEFHHTVTPDFATFISHQRESMIAPILVTQNLLLLEERIGKTSALALCGNAVTKIFCRQDDPMTCKWSSELIGKGWKTRPSGDSRDPKGNRTANYRREYDYHIQPDEFSSMAIKEAVILRKGVWLKSKWPLTPGGKGGTVKIVSG